MELSSLLILVVVLIYLAKNAKGKEFIDHCGNTMVNLAASADDASGALRKQCRELLSDEEAEEKSKAVEAKLAAAKAKAVKATSDNTDYDDFA